MLTMFGPARVVQRLMIVWLFFVVLFLDLLLFYVCATLCVVGLLWNLVLVDFWPIFWLVRKRCGAAWFLLQESILSCPGG